jgi:hypothetical protein
MLVLMQDLLVLVLVPCAKLANRNPNQDKPLVMIVPLVLILALLVLLRVRNVLMDTSLLWQVNIYVRRVLQE